MEVSMLCSELKNLFVASPWPAAFVWPVGLAAAEIATVSFQNGVNGYNGTFDPADRRTGRRSHRRDHRRRATSWTVSLPDRTSPDAQGLVRFDDIFGNDPNLIPLGATVLKAELVITTSIVSNAQTGGPWGVAGLLNPFDSTTSYFADFH